MWWWRRISPLVRRLTALAFLAALGASAAAHGEAQEVECTAVDTDGEPRSCTFTERLRQCADDVWESWKQCVDRDNDGFRDVSWWVEQFCDAMAAIDLLSCGVIVPWDYVIPPPPA